MIAPPLQLRWSYMNWAGYIATTSPPPPVTCSTTPTCTPSQTPGNPVLLQVIQDQFPVIAYGNVYVADLHDKRIMAWNLATGEPLPAFWSKRGTAPYLGSMNSSPAVANGILYVGANPASGWGPNLFAVNAFTGDYANGFPVDTGSYVYAPPIVKDGRVFVGTKQRGSFIGRMMAYNAGDATFLWSYTPSQGSIDAGAAISGNRLYFASDFYSASLPGVFCVDAASGVQIWSADQGGEVRAAIEVVDGWAYVATEKNSIRCYNAVTGVPNQNYPLTTNDYWAEFEGGMAIAEGNLFVGSYDDGLYSWNVVVGCPPGICNARSGFPVWSPTSIHSAATFCGGYVYYGSDDNILRAVNAANGRIEWTYALPTELGYLGVAPAPRSSAAISDGFLVVASEYANGVFVFEPIPAVPSPEPTRVVLHAWDNLVVPGQNTILYTWDLPGKFHVKLSIHNTAGEHIRTLYEGDCPGPDCYAIWDGFGAGRTRIASGVYVAVLAVRGRGVYRVRTAVLNQLLP